MAPLLLLLSFLPFIPISPVHAVAGGDPCPKQKCGDLEISYPFSLFETGPAAGAPPLVNPHCGNPALRLNCSDDGSQLVFRFGEDSYNVLHFDYGSATVTLADADASAASCPTLHNFTFGADLGNTLSYTRDVDVDLVFYYNCSHQATASDLEKQFPSWLISCLIPSTPGVPSFVFPDWPTLSPGRDLASTCVVVVAPALNATVAKYADSLGSSFESAIRDGFNLSWVLGGDGSCGRCEHAGGRCGYNVTSDGDVVAPSCLCADGHWDYEYQCTGKAAESKKTGVIVGVSVAAVVGFLLVAGAVWWLCYIRRRKKKVSLSSDLLSRTPTSAAGPLHFEDDVESGIIDVHAPHTHIFSYEELVEAAQGFDDSRVLGDGGFGTVYRGKLKDGRTIAIKRLYGHNLRPRLVEQFENEAAILSRLRHPNLVVLYGCTSSRSRELLLVYEFIPNGTVGDHLHGAKAAERALTWLRRLRIAIETADALAYLHAVDPPVIHRDVKTNNILLDAEYHVKVADFGLSRLFPVDASHVSTAPQGTPGYVDPEYHQSFQLTDKSDVYSFGVVLVELISSKPAVDIMRSRDEVSLAVMAVNKIQSGQLEQLVDPELGFAVDMGVRTMITMVAELAFRCLQNDRDMRPTVKEVLDVLREVDEEQRRAAKELDGGGQGASKVDAGAPFSPDSVTARWTSLSSTPNTSQ